MELKEKIQKLVYVYDLETLNIESTPPTESLEVELNEQLMAEHVPSLELRAAQIAVDACYLEYLNQNQDGTEEDFKNRVSGAAVEQVAQKIKSLLTPTVDINRLREIKRNKLLNLTKIDLGRQVKWEK